MKELIKISTNNEGKQVVSARELHEGLRVRRDYTTWIKGRIDKYGFEENIDYIVFTKNGENPKGGRPQSDYIITLDMAKELSMVENNDLGKQFRKYFIDCEKKLRSQNSLTPQEQLALQLFNGGLDAITAHQKLLELETKPLLEKIEEQQPKVQIADERLSKNGCYTITEINRSLGLKRGRLTKWAREQGYIHKTITEVNESGRPYFKIYDNGGYKAIGITEEGLSKIQENLENIK